ncbi:MAG: small-conductance mechanosensitive ion channel [Candidatus Dormibacteraeota bacterium]|nr:small-conductance mechanosensitive ion channel [Candidatus Dormibacteraeota bacterium]
MPTIHNFTEAVLVSVAGFFLLLPALIGAIILLVVGWFLADIVARLVGTLLKRIGFETMAQRTGVTGFIALTGARDSSASAIVAELIKWLIRLVFIEMAAEVLHITAITTLVNQIVLFIPSLIVALVVVMIGFLIASFVANVVRGGAAEMGFRNPNLLAGAARAIIVGLAVLMALSQIGIAPTLVNALFIAFVGAIALALGLAFGLGGREVAGQLWEKWYSTGRGAATRLEKKVAEDAQQEADAQPAAPQTSYETLPPPAPYPATHERHAG